MAGLVWVISVRNFLKELINQESKEHSQYHYFNSYFTKMRRYKYSLKPLKPVKVNDLIRIGDQNTDGGYIISERQIDLTKVLVGLGVSYDWSFEEDFKSKNPDAEIYCFDYSVSKKDYIKNSLISLLSIFSPVTWTQLLLKKRNLIKIISRPFYEIKTLYEFDKFFYRTPGNYFFNKGVSDYTDDIFVTVEEMLQMVQSFKMLPDNSVFIKVDIEGSEYDILEPLLDNKNKINGLTIEFHNLKHLWEVFLYVTSLLKRDFEIIHIHANNVGGYIPGTIVPAFLEISFIKRELLSLSELESINDQNYPLAHLDKPNISSLSDLNISFD